MNYSVKYLPPENLTETIAVYKKLTTAHRYLAELKGIAATIPNQSILINTLALQEAKDISFPSSLYQNRIFNERAANQQGYSFKIS